MSIPHLTMLDASPPQAVRAAAVAGFSAVGLRLFPTMPGETQHPMLGDTQMLRETLALIAGTGIEILDIEAIWLRADTSATRYVSGFAAAQRLGARVIQAIGDDPDESRLVETFGALCAAAAPYGLTVNLEYMAGAELNSLKHALRVVTAAAAPNARIMLDCLHINRCGTTPEELLALDERVINVLQLCDADAVAPVGKAAAMHEARFNRRLPGAGVLDLATIWSLVPAGIDVSVEVPLSDARGRLPLADRARVLKASADTFLARVGAPGGARPKRGEGWPRPRDSSAFG